MWNNEPEFYRGKYYARQGSGKNTKRKSLRTDRYDVAISRLQDLRAYNPTAPVFIKDIYEEYRAFKNGKDPHNKVEYMWRSLKPFFADLRPDQVTPPTMQGVPRI